MISLETPIREVPFCFVDIETTGFNPNIDRICEIAVVWEWNGKPREALSYLINPERSIPFEATQHHRITNEMVQSCYKFKDIAGIVRERLNGTVVVAHNADFDLPFIFEEFKRAGEEPPKIEHVICTLKLAKAQFRFPSNSLGNIARSLGLVVELEHTALADTLLLHKVFKTFLDDLQIERLKDLIDFQGGPIPFPKIVQV